MKKKNYPVIHALHTKAWLRNLMLVTSFGIMASILTVLYTAVKNPYDWTMG